jgi:hypothetical protein
MWRAPGFANSLSQYCQYSSIQKIYLVDNDYVNRPLDLVADPKLEIVNYGRNIYVNPAWNEGYYRSSADVICLLNDDIYVEPQVFDFVSELDFTEIDIIGVHLKGSVDNFHIVEHPDRREELIRLDVNKYQPIGGQSYAFGVCMFVKRSSYRVIPSLYQVWFGDDYLIQRSRNIYTLKTSHIHGEISKTIVSADIRDTVQKRIDLDARNVYKHNHFLNGSNWDIIQQTMRKQ